MDWAAIFQARPDLEPPGYAEASARAKAKPPRPKSKPKKKR